MIRLNVVDHPYAQMILTVLRDKNTGQIEFRKGLVRLGRVMGLEMVKEFKTREVEVETPLGIKAKGIEIMGFDKVVIITVLRAAMPLVEGLIKVFPAARQGVISARRVEEKGMSEDYSFEVEISYVKLPKISEEDTIIIADPMVATGSTIAKVMDIVSRSSKATKYFIVSAIITPYAIRRIEALSNELNLDVSIYTAAVDRELNDKGYILPGLGDAGDRAFGD